MKSKVRIGKIAVALMIYGIATIGFATLTSSLPLANAMPLGTEQLTGISLDAPVLVGDYAVIDNLGYSNGTLTISGQYTAADSSDLSTWIVGFNFGDISNYFIDGQAFENGQQIPEIETINGQLYNPGPIYGGNSVINGPWAAIFDANPALVSTLEQILVLGNQLELTVYRLPGVGDNNVNLSYTSQTSGTAPVPEPASILLLGSGLVGLAGIGRKKLKK